MSSFARIFILIGILFLVIGGVIFLFDRLHLPIGRLPGDIRIVRDNFTCIFPLATFILLSILLTVALNIIIRLLGRK